MAQVNPFFFFYVKIDGSAQGPFKGESRSQYHSQSIEGFRFLYEVKVPSDAVTGRTAGKRQHGAVAFTKRCGAATPQIFKALVTNELLKSVVFEFFRPEEHEGNEVLYQKITLTNATVTGIRQYSGEPESGPRNLEEVVSLVFGQITIEFMIPPDQNIATDERSTGRT